MTGVLIRRGNLDTEKHRTMEGENGVMCFQAKEHQGFLAIVRSTGDMVCDPVSRHPLSSVTESYPYGPDVLTDPTRNLFHLSWTHHISSSSSRESMLFLALQVTEEAGCFIFELCKSLQIHPAISLIPLFLIYCPL